MRDGTITKAAVPTLSDTLNLDEPGIGLYVGVSGDVKITTPNGDEITMVSLAAGVWHPIQTQKIWVTGTAATSILVGW